MQRKNYFIIPLVLLFFSLVACNQRTVSIPSLGEGTYPVDLIFKEFYEYLGGREILGDAISPLKEEGKLKFQFTDNSQMVYNPNAPAQKKIGLASLGLKMAVRELSVPEPTNPGLRYIGGHIIFPDFVPMYDRLYGEEFAGSPLGEVRYNEEKQRYEQFFEKVGFYRLEGDPPEAVHLLAYGARECGRDCRSKASLNSIIDVPDVQSTSLEAKVGFNSFIPFIADLTFEKLVVGVEFNLPNIYIPYLVCGSSFDLLFKSAITPYTLSFLGSPLTEPFKTPDGSVLQIFENIVLIADPAKPGEIRLYSLPKKIGILPDPLERASQDPLMSFYPIRGDLGYNIPSYFHHYIRLNGGFEVAGEPFTQLSKISEHVYRQCFTNLCLEEEQNPSEGLKIHPAPLGNTFKSIFYPTIAEIPKETQRANEVAIQVWEGASAVTSNEQQEIGIVIYENDSPLVGVEPYLVVTLADGSHQSYSMPPTAQDGQSRLILPAISSLSGTVIPYQVCVSRLTGEKFCVRDNFLIWNNP